MRLLPGLTTTDRAATNRFLDELRSSATRTIALFLTCLDREERGALYKDLESIAGLAIPHVHLRDDMGREEIEYLRGAFGTEVFNIHPRKSSHPYTAEAGEHRSAIFVENADVVPDAEDFVGYGGLCIDFAHWASGRLLGDPAYRDFESLARSTRIGCCHISSLRPGIRSRWGGFDHHCFETASELDYLLDYAEFLPENWASLELENCLSEQLEAVARLDTALARIRR